nr:glycosyl hydrolase family 18 protein [Paenibacillus beijingensis]
MRQFESLPDEPPFIAWKTIGSKINLTWEAVYKKDPDPSGFSELTGVNVISPTWFELLDGSGQIRSKADSHYVNWARNRGIQLWAVFSNGFEPKRTTQALSTVETRFYMIQQLLAYAKMYRLQGINIDFENVRTADKANLVQFVRELTPMLHEQNLVVSIDVTPKSNSELWSLFLDRPALIQSVDYMMLMAYDEHWASSPNSGSVASMPWVKRAVDRLVEEDGIPPAKLILGMPLYTRIWTETIGQNGKRKVSSKAVGMDRVREIIAAKKLAPVYDAATGQNYVEYSENGALNRIWIEDALSIKARVDLANRYGLAGVATWNRSFQSDDIWSVIEGALNKRS